MTPARGNWITLLIIAACFLLAASWGYRKYQESRVGTTRVIHLQTTNPDPPAGNNFLPEQRRNFALQFVLKFQGRDAEVRATTTGDSHTTIQLQSTAVSRPMVHEILRNNDVLRLLRRAGFKHLVMTNGKDTWDIDLKN